MTTNQYINKDAFFKKLIANLPESVINEIAFAYDLSKYGHYKQERDGGIRYFEHPKAVAYSIFHEFGIYDFRTIIVALLHDMKEDSYLLNEYRIMKIFGPEIAQSVHLLTKDSSHKGPGLKNYFERFYTVNDWVAIVNKLADRLHNMRTLAECSHDKQLKQVKETREYILPLVDLLKTSIPRQYLNVPDMFAKKLEDLCQKYEKINKHIKK